MNELIESIFKNFCVDGIEIPVKFLYYSGHGEPYVTYVQTNNDESLSGDDDLIGYVVHYDFDVYSKGNYNNLIKRLKELLKQNNFVWQPSQSSSDMYEPETGYYHKTLNFAIFKEE